MASTTALAPNGGVAAPVPASPAPQPSMDDAVRAVYEFALGKFQAGSDADAVRQLLLQQGLSPEIADRVVVNLIDARRAAIKTAKRGLGWKHVGIGAVVAVIGLAVTLGTYSAAASSGGGKYMIAWGAMLFGAIELLWGLVKVGTAANVSDTDVIKSWQS